MSATQTQNGHVPTSMWESALIRDGLQRLAQTLIERYLHDVGFEFTVAGLTVSIRLSPNATTIAMTYKEPECPSPDPEPSTVQSTVTATP